MSVSFWLIAAGLTLGALIVAAWPLWSGRREAPPNAAHDVSVYKAQLAEVDRDLARGVISEAEAEGARREIARRLLAADAALAKERSFATASEKAARYGLLAIGGPLAAVGLALYLYIGAPARPDQPFEARDIAAERSSMLLTQAEAESEARARGLPQPPPIEPETAALIERMKAALRERAEDSRGRLLLADAYLRLGRPGEAWPLFEEAIGLIGAEVEPRLHAAKGDAMVQAAGGYVSREAEAAFQRSESFMISQYMLGAAEAQRSEFRRAFARWVALYNASVDQPFAVTLRQQIERIAPSIGEQAVAAAARLPEPTVGAAPAEEPGAPLGLGAAAPAPADEPAPGPTAEQVAEAAAMGAEERAEMIEGMVAGLAARLEDDPDDLGGWVRLIRAYGVLGRTEAQNEALASARAAFAEDEAALAALAAAAGTERP